MSGNLIITIGRQSGSGGKKIGEMLAEKLGVKCYDKELLAQAPNQQFSLFSGNGFLFYGLYSYRLFGYADQS